MSIPTQLYHPSDDDDDDKVRSEQQAAADTDDDDDTDDVRTVRSTTTSCSATTVQRSNVSYQKRAATTTTTTMSDQKSRHQATQYNSLQEWAISLGSGTIHDFRDGLDDDAGRPWILGIVLSRVPSRKNNPPDQAEVSAALEQALCARQPVPPPLVLQDMIRPPKPGLSNLGEETNANTDADSTSLQTNGSNAAGGDGSVMAAMELGGAASGAAKAANIPDGPNNSVDQVESSAHEETTTSEAGSSEREPEQNAHGAKRSKVARTVCSCFRSDEPASSNPKNNDDDDRKYKKQCRKQGSRWGQE